MKRFLIAIQARSRNERLPGKCNMLIDGISMLDRVIYNCNGAVLHINRLTHIKNVEANLILVVPDNDPLAEIYRHKMPVIEGHENDVLSRYMTALNKFPSDYLVRITSDCPLLPAYLIQRAIIIARSQDNTIDYLSNVFPELRTAPDGHDVEIISNKLMEWLDKNVSDKFHREHVTSYLSVNRPTWAKFGQIMNHHDMSDIKISVDTKEDLDKVIIENRNMQNKLSRARDLNFGIFKI